MVITNLLTNMLVLALSGEVPSNTPAFQDHASGAMFTNAQRAAREWRLDESLIATNQITAFQSTPYADGYSATIVFFDRYLFGLDHGDGIGFTDKQFSWDVVFAETNRDFLVRNNINSKGTQKDADAERAWIAALRGDEARSRAIAERWAKTTNALTLRKAQAIAEAAVRAEGISIRSMGVPKVTQATWEEEPVHVFMPGDAVKTNAAGDVVRVSGVPEEAGEQIAAVGPLSDGTWCITYQKARPRRLLLPYYKFEWKSEAANCRVDVSGITGTVAHFSYDDAPAALKTPKNYLKLLGLPANTLFVRQISKSPAKYEILTP